MIVFSIIVKHSEWIYFEIPELPEAVHVLIVGGVESNQHVNHYLVRLYPRIYCGLNTLQYRSLIPNEIPRKINPFLLEMKVIRLIIC